MKKLLLFMLTVLFINTSWAQEAPPEMFKFQAYIYKPNGNPVEDKTVGIEISIYQTAINGTLVYTEEFTTTTNKNGIINLEIGNGTPAFGVFSEIPWGVGEFFLELSADINGGTNYTIMGASQLLSVPYALLAKNALSALDDFDTDPTNEIELPETANENDVLTYVNGVWVAQATTESFNFYYADKDEDGFGDKWNVVYADETPEGYVLNNEDCDDSDAAVNPDAIEVCDGIDNNCDGLIDEGVKTTYYADTDEDGYGDSQNSTDACSVPSGYVSDNSDCNDTNPAVNPGAIELCNNSIDDDCNGSIDVNCVPQIGDFLEGGVVFWIFQPGEPGYVEGETHGLVCSIYNVGYKIWSPGYYRVDTSYEIGYGSSNTENIIAAMPNSIPLGSYAAGYISEYYNFGGFTDWYLPSNHELYKMFFYRSLVNATSVTNGGYGLSSSLDYWSSSQLGNDPYRATFLDTSQGNMTYDYKNRSKYLRPVRTF